MEASNPSGKIYDVSELPRLKDFLAKQEIEFQKIDAEKSIQNKKILQYTLIITGAVVSLYVFSRLVNKLK
jgi:hypothetical protein